MTKEAQKTIATKKIAHESFNTLGAFYETVGTNPMKSQIYDAIYVIIHTFFFSQRDKRS